MTIAEKEIKTGEREKYLGILAMMGRVCHDLNQPLMAIGAYSELISMKLPKEDPLHETIYKMTEQVEKMGRITRKLMNLSKQGSNGDPTDYAGDIDKTAMVTKYSSFGYE